MWTVVRILEKWVVRLLYKIRVQNLHKNTDWVFIDILIFLGFSFRCNRYSRLLMSYV